MSKNGVQNAKKHWFSDVKWRVFEKHAFQKKNKQDMFLISLKEARVAKTLCFTMFWTILYVQKWLVGPIFKA